MIDLLKYLGVGETNNMETERFENPFPFLVSIDLVLVNWAIDLNNQGCFQAGKVDNKPVDSILAMKSMAA